MCVAPDDVWASLLCGVVVDLKDFLKTSPFRCPPPPAFTARVLNSTPAMAPPPPSLSQISVLSSINSSMSMPSVVGQQSLEWDDWDEDDDDEKKSWWKNSHRCRQGAVLSCERSRASARRDRNWLWRLR